MVRSCSEGLLGLNPIFVGGHVSHAALSLVCAIVETSGKNSVKTGGIAALLTWRKRRLALQKGIG